MLNLYLWRARFLSAKTDFPKRKILLIYFIRKKFCKVYSLDLRFCFKIFKKFLHSQKLLRIKQTGKILILISCIISRWGTTRARHLTSTPLTIILTSFITIPVLSLNSQTRQDLSSTNCRSIILLFREYLLNNT